MPGSVADVMAHFNRETLVIPQCETAEALADIEHIAAMDGVAIGLDATLLIGGVQAQIRACRG